MQANIIYQVYDSQRRIERREQRERDRRLSLLAATMRRRWRPIVAVRSRGWGGTHHQGLEVAPQVRSNPEAIRTTR